MASPQNYTLGRGKLHFAQFKPDTQIPAGFRYIGNTPSITMTSESENLDHYSSDEGVRNKDESVLLQLDRSGAFTTDSIRPANMAMLLLGDYSTVTTTAGTGTITVIEADIVKQGETYQLGVTPTAPAGARMVSNVVVTNTTTPATTYAAGTDYVFDGNRGLLTVMEGGAIADGTGITATFDVGASERIQVVGGSKTIEGALMYISANPAGEQFDYLWPWVKLSPNGDFELKGDEWQTLGFNFEILKKDPLSPVYVNGQAKTTGAP